MKKILITIYTVFSICCFAHCNPVGSQTFDIILNNTRPDYFRFIDTETKKEIGSEGIIFTIPDAELKSSAQVSVKYDIPSGSTLTLHRTATRDWSNDGTGYMLIGEANDNSGLNYNIVVTGTTTGVSLDSLYLTDESQINTPIQLNNYDLVIFSKNNGNAASGTVDFKLELNPPKYEDNDPYYMKDVYYGFLTMSLVAE